MNEIKHHRTGVVVGHFHQIVEEDIGAILYALDNNGDFKVHFVHQYLITCKWFLANSEILHHMFGVCPCREFDALVVSNSLGKQLLTFAIPSL